MTYISKDALDGLPKGEYVYLIRDVEVSGFYKIGKTKRPKARIEDEFGVKLPFKIQVLRMIPTHNASLLEQMLHRKYAHQRKNGEWFDLDEAEVREILGMGNSLGRFAQSDNTLYSVMEANFGNTIPVYLIDSALDDHNVLVAKPNNELAEIFWSQGIGPSEARIPRYQKIKELLPSNVTSAYVMAQMLLKAVELAKSMKD